MYPGGDYGFRKDLQANLIYSQSAIAASIEGRVYLN